MTDAASYLMTSQNSNSLLPGLSPSSLAPRGTQYEENPPPWKKLVSQMGIQLSPQHADTSTSDVIMLPRMPPSTLEKNVNELISVVLNDEFEQQIERAKLLDVYENTAFSPLNTIDEDQGTKLPLLSSLHLPLTPLTGVAYEADRSRVHQSLVSFTTGQPSEHWIKSVNGYNGGRRSMTALKNHFSGKGNAKRRIAEADCFKETLHYKNERSLPFKAFLTKCETMYNIYAQHKEEMTKDAKIRFLFKKIQHTGLSSAIEAMKAKITTEH